MTVLASRHLSEGIEAVPLNEFMQFTHNIVHDAVLGITTITIAGEFDSREALDVRSIFTDAVDKKPKKIVVDLQGLQLIDSSGVGAIVSLFKGANKNGIKFEVVHVNGQPRAIFKVLRLDKVFNIRD